MNNRVDQLAAQCIDLTEPVSALLQANHILCDEVRRLYSQRYTSIATPLDRTAGSLPSFWSPVQSSLSVVDVSIDQQEVTLPLKKWIRADNLRKIVSYSYIPYYMKLTLHVINANGSISR